MGWFDNTELNRVKNGTRCLFQTGVRDWETLGASQSMLRKGVCDTVAEVMDAQVAKRSRKFILQKNHEWRNEFLFTSRLTQNRDVDMNGFLWSSPNPVVASSFGDSEIIQRAPIRRGYFVMKSWLLNSGDDVHGQAIRERITVIVQRSPSPLFVLAFPSRVRSPILNYATSNERAD